MGQLGRLDRKFWLEAAGYRYSAFLSWPRGTSGDLVERLAVKLQQEIQRQVSIHGLPDSVFLDTQHIGLGEAWYRRIATAICRSITLIAVCGPEYYCSEYCGKEWGGMETLAAQRLGDLKIAILPLIWQSARAPGGIGLFQDEKLPPQVDCLNWRDFSRLRLRRPNVEESDEFDDFVREIVSRIDLAAAALFERNARTGDCDHFELPKESAFREFNQAAQQYPFTRQT
jgi:hypothetical protein